MLAFAIIVCLLVAGESTAHRPPTVQTPLGRVAGYRMTSRSGRTFLAFSGLPYAQPPVGNLRFEPPVGVKPWTGVRDATTDGPFCIQYNTFDASPAPVGVEDCLYLSIYTHDVSGRAAVLVHFHGGGFISGNGARNTGPQYLMDHDVVVVNVNFRVGVFGFLSFEDLDMPGNQGLKDHVQALRWIQQNIASFGGDPNKVTIVGESSGAGSVYHHTVSPLSRDLFHGAISESGTSYNPWAISRPGSARESALALLQLMKCNYTSTLQAVACLRAIDPVEMLSKFDHFNWWQIERTHDFSPVLEPPSPGAFLVGPVKKWHHEKVPLLMGMTSAEGLIRTIYFPYYNVTYEWLTENYEKIFPKSLKLDMTSTTPLEVARALRRYYFPNGDITDRDWKNLTTLYSDAWFVIGVMDGANRHPDDVYFYYFDYIGDNSIGGPERNTTVIFGSFHTEEINYIWKQKNIGDLKGEDLELSKKLAKIWTDFAKYGNPSGNGRGLRWDKWTKDHHRYMHISNDGFKMEEGVAEDRYKFWKTLNYYDVFENA